MNINVGDIICYGWQLYAVASESNDSYQLSGVETNDKVILSKQELNTRRVTKSSPVVVRYTGVAKSIGVTLPNGRMGTVHLVSGTYLILNLAVMSHNCLTGSVRKLDGTVLWSINDVQDLNNLSLLSANTNLYAIKYDQYINVEAFTSIEEIINVALNYYSMGNTSELSLVTLTYSEIGEAIKGDYIHIGADLYQIESVNGYYCKARNVYSNSFKDVIVTNKFDIIRKPLVIRYNTDTIVVQAEYISPFGDITTRDVVLNNKALVTLTDFTDGVYLTTLNNEIICGYYDEFANNFELLTGEFDIYNTESKQICNETPFTDIDDAVNFLSRLRLDTENLKPNYTYLIVAH